MQRGASITLVLSALVTFVMGTGNHDSTNHACGLHTVRVSGCTSACQPSCDVPQPTFCTAVCILDGCVCKKGYIRLNGTNSRCVRESKCPQPRNGTPRNSPKNLNCGPNTVRVTSGCVDYCPPSCAVRMPTICPLICLINGCNCREGYIRSGDRNSLCIRPSECPCTDQTTTMNS